MRLISVSGLVEGEGTLPHRVVLYRRPHSVDPYVVHFAAEGDEDGDRDLWGGIYCSDLVQAAKHFATRCRGRGVTDATNSMVEGSVVCGFEV